MSRTYQRTDVPRASTPDLIHALMVTVDGVPAFAVDTRPRLNPVLAQRPLRPGESLYVDMGAEDAATIGLIRPVRKC